MITITKNVDKDTTVEVAHDDDGHKTITINYDGLLFGIKEDIEKVVLKAIETIKE